MDALRQRLMPPQPLTREQAIVLANRDPLAYFQHRDSPYPWPPASDQVIYLPALTLQIDRYTLGYIERCTVFMDTHEARIGHIATGTEFNCLEIGTLLARAFIAELKQRYRVVSVRFEEDCSRYDKAHYPQFFASLGAREIYNPGWRSSWSLTLDS